MRSIEFKGKKLSDGAWVCGLPFYSYGLGEWKITHSDGWLPSFNNPDQGESTIHTEVDPYTISEFIGRLDRNDVKIFENDICELRCVFAGSTNNGLIIGTEPFDYTYTGVVKFMPSLGFYLKIYKVFDNDNSMYLADGEFAKTKSIVSYRTKVIGNYFDNSYLLKQTQCNQ